MKRWFNCIIVLLCATFLLCCKAKEEGLRLIKGDDVSFHLGWKPSYRCNGTYFDSKIGKDLFYFTEYNTNKCMKLFDEDFNLINTIKLDSLPNRGMIRAMQVIDHDTILVLCGFRPVEFAYLVNFEGKVVGEVNFESPIKQDTNNIQLDHSSGDVDFYYDGNIYMKYTFNESHYFANYSYDLVTHSDSMMMDYPFMVSINLDNNPITLDKLFDNIYKENYKYGYAIDSYARYCIANGKLFMPIGHNANLYVADLKTKQIEKVLKVSSKYTQTGFDIEDYKFAPDHYKDLKHDEYIHSSSIAGGFYSVIWDKYRKVYYFVIKHSCSDYNPQKKRYHPDSFSIQVFDENFNKKGETKFLVKDYWYGESLINSKGLLVQKRNASDDKGIKGYSLFTISD